MIANKLQEMIGQALKAHDEVRLSTLRLLSSALNYEKIERQHELTEEEELNVIKKQAKQRKDSIDSYIKAGRVDMAESEKAELAILQEFLPPEMTDEELSQLVESSIKEVGATTMADIGKIMGAVKSKAANVDGGRVVALIKEKLNG